MTAAARTPFKFLDPYTRADRDIFFGRDRETEEIYARLLAAGLLLVYGVSGSGKTSLVQCGLANKFEPADCLAITVRRGANLLEALDAELARHALSPPPPGAPLKKRVRSLYLDHFKPIHLIFDQLEELFIFGDREERRAFGLALHDLANLERDVRLIFVVREEYLAAMTEFEPLLPDLFRSRIRIERMDRFQAREAIEGPCERCGVALDPGVAEEVLTRLAPAEATVELTWLQVVMDRLYRQAADLNPERPALTLAGLAGLGRLDNVLGRFLEEQLTALDQPLAGEAVLKALVSDDGTRRPLSLAAIADSATVRAQGLTGDALPALVQRLIAARILSDRDEHGNYELRHDSLARKVWERMTAREKELQEIRQTIDIRYRDYRRRGLLLDAETLTYLAPYEDSLFLPPEQAAFVKTSREAAARRRRRWLTLAFSTLILVLLVVSGLGVYGYLKAVEAERQQARAEQQAAEATRKEKDARHNLGLVFVQKAEQSLENRRFNETRLYALHALAKFDVQRPGSERATSILLGHPFYRLGFAVASHRQTGDNVKGLSFSADGRTLAASYGNTIRFWDMATGKEKGMLTDHSSAVTSVSWSPDGDILASGSTDAKVRVWDVKSANIKAEYDVYTPNFTMVRFSPDGRTLGWWWCENTIHLLDIRTGKKKELLLPHTSAVNAFTFSPDGQTVASGSSDKSIRLLNLASGNEKAVLLGHAGEVTSVSFSPDGRTLASGSDDKIIRLWDVGTGKAQVLAGHTDRVTSVSFSPDGRTVASASADKTVRLWDVSTGKEKAVLTGQKKWIWSVSFSPNGQTLASVSNDNTILVWDMATGKEALTLSGHTSSVTGVTFSADNASLASGSYDKTVRLWDLTVGKETAVLTGHLDGVLSVSVAPNGQTLASGSVDHSIRLWDLPSGKERKILVGHTDSVTSLSFSPDGRTLASESRDKTIRLWDVAAGKESTVFTEAVWGDEPMRFSADGQTFFLGALDNTMRRCIRLRDVATGKERETAVLADDTNWVQSWTFSPDDHYLAGGFRFGKSDKSICLWDMTTGKKKITLSGHTSDVNLLIFSGDARILASASYDNSIRLWDVERAREIAMLSTDTDLLSMSFAPDGRTLAAGLADNTVRLWDLSFLHDPRPLEEQVKDAEAQFGLRMVDLQLQPTPPHQTTDGAQPQPPRWSPRNPLHWLPAAERGDPAAMLQLGILYDRANDLPRAETWYRQAADAGAPEAKDRLDFLHRRQAQRATDAQAVGPSPPPAGDPP